MTAEYPLDMSDHKATRWLLKVPQYLSEVITQYEDFQPKLGQIAIKGEKLSLKLDLTELKILKEQQKMQKAATQSPSSGGESSSGISKTAESILDVDIPLEYELDKISDVPNLHIFNKRPDGPLIRPVRATTSREPIVELDVQNLLQADGAYRSMTRAPVWLEYDFGSIRALSGMEFRAHPDPQSMSGPMLFRVLAGPTANPTCQVWQPFQVNLQAGQSMPIDLSKLGACIRFVKIEVLQAFTAVSFGCSKFFAAGAEVKPIGVLSSAPPATFADPTSLITFQSAPQGSPPTSGPFNSFTPAPVWVEIDLGKPILLSHLDMKIDQQQPGIAEHRIFAGTTPDPQHQVTRLYGPMLPGQQFRVTMDKAGIVRYIRVLCLACQGYVAWSFIRVFGVTTGVEGVVVQSIIAKPTDAEAARYRAVCSHITKKTNEHRTSKTAEAVLPGQAVQRRVVAERRVEDPAVLRSTSALFVPQKRKVSQMAAPGGGLGSEDLKEKLFELFETHENLSLRELQEKTGQPVAALKEVLTDICEYQRRGPNRSTYQLKSEYKISKS